RVELHQLARIVLVEAAALSPRRRARRWSEPRRRKTTTTPRGAAAAEGGVRAVGLALPVVEIEEHRRTVRHGAEQITEISKRIRTNDVAIVRGEIESFLGTL